MVYWELKAPTHQSGNSAVIFFREGLLGLPNEVKRAYYIDPTSFSFLSEN